HAPVRPRPPSTRDDAAAASSAGFGALPMGAPSPSTITENLESLELSIRSSGLVEYAFFSWKTDFSAVNAALSRILHSDCFERAWNFMKFGTAIAARMPITQQPAIATAAMIKMMM